MRQVSDMIGSPKRSALLSGILHAAAIALVLLATSGTNPPVVRLGIFPRLEGGIYLVPVTPRKEDGGGGGGLRSGAPASRGRLPRAAPRQFTPPVVMIENLDPKLPMEPTLVGPPDLALPVLSLAQFGDPSGVLGPPSAGPGRGGGIGRGFGGGVGNGAGPGYDPGRDGGSAALEGQTGTVAAPVLLWKIDPEYSDEARKSKIQGLVVLYIEVDARGQAARVSVRQGLGLGLDERAVEAVRRWKFRPGYRGGRPVTMSALVEVTFRLL